MNQERIHATIQFHTGLGGHQQVRHITKWWNGERHMENYMNFMERKHGWMVDEIFITPK